MTDVDEAAVVTPAVPLPHAPRGDAPESAGPETPRVELPAAEAPRPEFRTMAGPMPVALPPPPPAEEHDRWSDPPAAPAPAVALPPPPPAEELDHWSDPPAAPAADAAGPWSVREPPRVPAVAREPVSDAPDVWSTREPVIVHPADRKTAPNILGFDLDAPTATEPESEPEPAAPGIALDGFTHGIEPLDGLVVFALGDGSVYGSWVRPDAGFSAADVAPVLREAYRASLQAARKLAIFSAAAAERAQVGEPIVTIETLAQTALLKRVRAYVVACLFDASMPLGMARLCAARLASSLEPELPLTDLARLTLPPPATGGARGSRPPNSLRLSMPRKAPHANAAEVEHVRKVIAYAEANLPDPHTVRLRLSLRSHTPRLALDHPETMASDAVLRIETAVLEMLGIDREQLGLALLGEKS